MNSVNVQRASVAAILVALAGMTACTRPITGTARPEPPPHVFPDLGAFTSADPEKFYIPLRGGPVYRFSTPAGLSCQISLGDIGCWGRFSSDFYGADDRSCSDVSQLRVGAVNYDRGFTIERIEDGCEPSDYPLLNVGQKIDLDWSRSNPEIGDKTCAVGPKQRIACIDGYTNRGFVIEPTGAWTF